MERFMGRHAPEFQRAFRNHKFERIDNGSFLFPEQKIVVAGEYILGLNGKELERCHNLLPTEGLNWMLNNLGNTVAIAAAYISLYANALTPIAAHVQASYPSTYSEITSGSEGYSESTRVLWDAGAAAAAAVNNYSSAAVFTIVTASSLTVNGVALHTSSAKGATTGSLLSASRFGTARVFSNTDEFDVKYQVSMTSS
jgi:hypothetical protein